MDQLIDENLSSLWYDVEQSSAFSGINNLYRVVKAKNLPYTKKQVETWLKEQETYQLFRPARHRFKRPPIISYGLNFLFECDLAFFPDLKWQMGNHNIILVVVDVFSKFILAEPIRTKKATDVAEAFKKIFAKRVCQLVRTDAGVEFLNFEVQGIFKEYNAHHYIARNAPKAANAERAIKTIKGKVYKYFHENPTKRQFLSEFQKIIDGLNNTFNVRIGMKPVDVTIEHTQMVFERLYPDFYSKILKKSKPLYNVDDVVRVSKLKSAFQKGARKNFSKEKFKIIRVLNTRSPPQYKLKSIEDDAEIYGSFFSQELMPAASKSSHDNIDISDGDA